MMSDRRRLHPSRVSPYLLFALVGLAAPLARAEDRADIVVADFEGDDYGGWAATGEAFGGGPAKGTLPGQMHVDGFLGKGLVNSFRGGDGSTGTLTSPEFTIRRPFLNFLIGGGHHPGETCLDLMVEGSPVRTATGPNDRPGGTETLDWASWDVGEFVGKTATLRIVDRHKGGWGHINVDQIVQSDRKRGVGPVRRELVVGRRYLHLPVSQEAPVRRVKLAAGGQVVREFDIRLAEGRPAFWVFSDLDGFRGKSLTIETALPEGSRALEAIAQGDAIPAEGELYREKHRPQFHFTSRRGWLNDPNGLLWHDGEYHLYYQHNPYGWDWGNMHWGHAVSRDLVHWTELPIAVYPKQYGDWAFSGSGVVDAANTSGFGSAGAGPLVAAFTSTGRGECILYSNDRGRTWSEYAKNPVVKHVGRDPRLLWHEPTSRWVMAVYDEADGRRDIVFLSSPDLKTWTEESRIGGFFECPDLFELPVAGRPDRKLWVLYAADGEYLLGRFDGRRFTPESEKKQRTWYGNFYAAQTFSNAPDGRRVQIGWGQGIAFPGMPFNQQMALPCELTLRPTDEGVRMFARPVAELSSLRAKSHSWRDLAPEAGENPLSGLSGDLFEIRAEAEVGEKGTLTLTARGVPVVYDAAKRTLSCGNKSAPLAGEGGKVRLWVFVDRGSIEVFGNDGRVAISHGVIPEDGNRSLAIAASGDGVRVRTLEVDELASAWKR
jgi:fructan beta-fructosidase